MRRLSEVEVARDYGDAAARSFAQKPNTTVTGYYLFHLVPRDGRRFHREGIGDKSVYALVDPRDGGVRYVGATGQTLDSRLANHLRTSTVIMKAWLDDMRKDGTGPRVERLTWARDDNWERCERWWIAWFRVRAYLLNVDPGGVARTTNGWVKKKAIKLGAEARRLALIEFKKGGV